MTGGVSSAFIARRPSRIGSRPSVTSGLISRTAGSRFMGGGRRCDVTSRVSRFLCPSPICNVSWGGGRVPKIVYLCRLIGRQTVSGCGRNGVLCVGEPSIAAKVRDSLTACPTRILPITLSGNSGFSRGGGSRAIFGGGSGLEVPMPTRENRWGIGGVSHSGGAYGVKVRLIRCLCGGVRGRRGVLFSVGGSRW